MREVTLYARPGVPLRLIAVMLLKCFMAVYDTISLALKFFVIDRADTLTTRTNLQHKILE